MAPVRSLFVACALVFSSIAMGQHVRFIVAGDGRSDPGAKPPRKEDKNGINVLITREMARAVIRENAQFLMWTGDLVLGAKTRAGFKSMLMDWRGIMKPLYDRHIPVLVVRGNHESGSEDSIAVWNEVFKGRYKNPENGPSTEKNLSFYYEQGPVLAIGLDEYVFEPGNIAVNQPWLDTVLKDHLRKPFIFAMGHEPAFMDGAHKDLLDNDEAKRDQLWESLISSGSRVFFAGHDHLYDHMKVFHKGHLPSPILHQIVAGTAGAPFYKKGEYTGANGDWELTRIKNIVNTYGYVVVDIVGKMATITFKGRVGRDKYVPMDSLTYPSPWTTSRESRVARWGPAWKR